ncbi:MAG: hypothetical protein ACOYT8_02100 [Candidatus Dependentiae bacterium]
MTLTQEIEEGAGLEFKVFEKGDDKLTISLDPFLLAKWDEKARVEMGAKKANDEIIELLRIEALATR